MRQLVASLSGQNRRALELEKCVWLLQKWECAIKTYIVQKLSKIINRFCEIRKFEMQHMKPVLEKNRNLFRARVF